MCEDEKQGVGEDVSEEDYYVDYYRKFKVLRIVAIASVCVATIIIIVL